MKQFIATFTIELDVVKAIRAENSARIEAWRQDDLLKIP